MKPTSTKSNGWTSHSIALALALIIAAGLASPSLAQPAGAHKAQQPRVAAPGQAAFPTAVPGNVPAEKEGYVSGQSICLGKLHHHMPCYSVD